MELAHRPRRLRRSKIIRDLVGETTVKVRQLIQPYFVCDDSGVRDEIKGLLILLLRAVVTYT